MTSNAPLTRFVIKRSGERQKVDHQKIFLRIQKFTWGLSPKVDPNVVFESVIRSFKNGMTTTEIDELAAGDCAQYITTHPDYSILAARIAIGNLHKNTKDHKNFTDATRALYNYKDPKTGADAKMIHEKQMAYIEKHGDAMDSEMQHNLDFNNYDYFGFATLRRQYSLRVDDEYFERPQHILMRVAAWVHQNHPWEDCQESFRAMRAKKWTLATPSLMNAGTRHPQLSSCFLLPNPHDSIDGIYDTIKATAIISKNAGGIGFPVHSIRAAESKINGTNGISNGIVPMLRNFNSTARYVDQGGGKRKGSFAIYLEPWHADIKDFLNLKLAQGVEEERCRDLVYALWINDKFMRAVESNGDWHLFCPAEVKGVVRQVLESKGKVYDDQSLNDFWGAEFDEMYDACVAADKAREVIKAQALWKLYVDTYIETGMPFPMFKDTCNRKSNHRHLGTIQSSNLCTEVVQFTSNKEGDEQIAVCNLSSISLPAFVKADGGYDFRDLQKQTRLVTRNLNRVIDVNYYPLTLEPGRTRRDKYTGAAERSNKLHRPIGIGVQGLQDVFFMKRLPFDSPEARALNKKIFACIYFAALTESCELARLEGPHPSYEGSPASKGELQFDLWGVEPHPDFDWESLRADIKRYGLRNSLLTAPMPTATTSQLLGNTECVEAINSNIYVRRTLAGEFVVVSRYLIEDLMALNLWSREMKNRIIAHNGSIQNIPEIPKDIKLLHRTVWEISQKAVEDMAADRGAYIDQSQSLNIHMANATYGKVSSMIFHAWEIGLKGLYYLRTKPASDAQKFTVDPNLIAEQAARDERSMLSSMDPNSTPVASSAPRSSSSIAHSDVLILRTAEQIKRERLERERAEEALIQRQAEERGDACSGGMCSA